MVRRNWNRFSDQVTPDRKTRAARVEAIM